MNIPTSRPAIGASLYFALAFSLSAYFTFAAVQGDYGVFRQVQIKAEAEAKTKADQAAAAKAAAEREAAEDALRQKRAAERTKMAAERSTGKVDNVVPMTPAAEQKSEPEKILDRLDWVHRRVSLY
jgi:acetyl-CoA carboxylase carboxyltransferase component